MYCTKNTGLAFKSDAMVQQHNKLSWYSKGTSWCVDSMVTSSNGNIWVWVEFEFVNGEFPAHRPVTRSVDVFYDLRLNKRLSKQPWGWWFEKPSLSLWRHCNGRLGFIAMCIIEKLAWNVINMSKQGRYRQTYDIRRILVDKKIVDHSDVPGASTIGAAPTTSLFST